MDTEKIALTWSPDQKQYAQYKLPMKQLCAHMEVIRCIKLAGDYKCYPEFHNNGNLHYHFIVELKDKIKWFKKVLPTLKYHGFVVVKPATDFAGWLSYCTKHQQTVEHTLKILLPITKSFVASVASTEYIKRQYGDPSDVDQLLDSPLEEAE